MSDEPDTPFYTPGLRRTPQTKPRPGERLWSLRRPRDGAVMDCELRSHGEYGWECQTFLNGESCYGRRPPRHSGVKASFGSRWRRSCGPLACLSPAVPDRAPLWVHTRTTRPIGEADPEPVLPIKPPRLSVRV